MITYSEFVNRPLALYSQIQHQVENVHRLETICMTTTMELKERVQTSRDNSLEKRYATLVDAARKLEEMTAELQLICDEVKDFLYETLEYEDADILEWKYVNGKSIKEIAILKNMTYSGAATKISRAEKKAEKAYLSRNAKH